VKAKEAKGRRFLLLSNPWGESGEWTGAWGDGSNEWTSEWIQALGHKFGNDGRFYMEYVDFLRVWDSIHKCLLFNDTWHVSSAHIQAKVRPWPAAPSFGDVSFTVTLTERSPAIFVLSQHDSRYWRGLEGYLWWSLEFRVFRTGEKEYLMRSEKGIYDQRSVSVEFKDLEPGEYIVHVRLDRMAFRERNYMDRTDGSASKLYRVHAKLMESRALAPNYDRASAEANVDFVAPPAHLFDGQAGPVSAMPKLSRGEIVGRFVEWEKEKAGTPAVGTSGTTGSENSAQTATAKAAPKPMLEVSDGTVKLAEPKPSPLGSGEEKQEPTEAGKVDAVLDDLSSKDQPASKAEQQPADPKQPAADSAKEEERSEEERSETDSVFLYMRVYSKDAKAGIGADARL